VKLNPGDPMNLRAVNRPCGPVLHTFTDDAGRTWNITRGLGEPFVRVYAGYDLDKRTLPYIAGPGVAGRPRRGNLQRLAHG
jgi:hypothetical protein